MNLEIVVFMAYFIILFGVSLIFFFNGSNLSGYDYTAPGYEFIVVEYEVLKTGSTEPAITFEVVSDLSDKAYADSSSGKLINGAKIMSVYS